MVRRKCKTSLCDENRNLKYNMAIEEYFNPFATILNFVPDNYNINHYDNSILV